MRPSTRCPCIEKELLASVASLLGEADTLSLYRKLLGSTVLSTMDLNNFGALTDETVGRMYRMDEQSKKPAFFKLSDISALPRLSVALGRSLAVYRLGGHSGPVKVYDNRVPNNLSRAKGKECLFVILNAKGRNPRCVLGMDSEPPKELVRAAWLSEKRYALQGAAVGEMANGSVACLLRRLGEDRWSASARLPEERQSERDLIRWCISEEGEKRIAALLGQHDVLRLVTNVGRDKFLKLAQVPDVADLREKNVLNFALCADKKMYRTSPEIDRKLKDSWTQDTDCVSAPKMLSRAVLPHLKSPEEGGAASPTALTSSKKLRCGAVVRVSGPPPPPCSCESCRDSLRLYPNFSDRSHTQRPYRIEPTLKEYMKILGLWTPENRKLYERALALSVAAVDCETVTEVSPGLGASDGMVGVAGISDQRHDTSTRLQQKVVMVGHFDGDSSKDKSRIFTVTKDRSLHEVMREYLAHVVERKEAREREKRVLLAPLLRLANTYKEAHLAFCDMERPDREERYGGYYRGLYGRFHSRLERLCQLYVVNGYNGAKFDFPILLPSLSLAAHEAKGVTLRVQKKGSAVTSMTLLGRRGSGITFRDPILLLDTSCSLAKLAKMCQLELQKAPMPYRQLDSLDCVQRKEFSWEPEHWRDELNGGTATPEEIAECRRLFSKLGCRNVGDYLREYLNIDCQLLKDCSVKLYDQFEKTLDVSPLDAGRFTIASYSNFCTQLYLFRNRRPAMFMGRVPCMYNVLSAATTGGLVEVARQRVVCNDKVHGTINPHFASLSRETLLPPPHEAQPIPPASQRVMDEALSEDGRKRIPFFNGCRTGYMPGEEFDPVVDREFSSDEAEAKFARIAVPDPDALSVRHVVNSAVAAADNDATADETIEEARSGLGGEERTAGYISCLDIASEYATSCESDRVISWGSGPPLPRGDPLPGPRDRAPDGRGRVGVTERRLESRLTSFFLPFPRRQQWTSLRRDAVSLPGAARA